VQQDGVLILFQGGGEGREASKKRAKRRKLANECIAKIQESLPPELFGIGLIWTEELPQDMASVKCLSSLLAFRCKLAFKSNPKLTALTETLSRGELLPL